MPRSTPRIDEKAFLVEAISQHKAGNYERARDLYLAILTQNPKNAGAIFRLGTLALHIENYEKAVEFIEEAIEVGPATSSMHVNLGTALRNLERYDEAVAAYDQALTFKENRADSYYNKGCALQADKRHEEARKSYKEALAINDQDADAWINLGTVQRELNDLDQALHSFESAARIKPDLGAAFGNAAAILFDRALFEISTVLMDKAIELDPNNIDYRYRLAIFLLTFGKLEQGWKDFDTRFIAEEKAKAAYRLEPPPYWNEKNIKDLTGKKILFWTEQGLGEEILFAGILPDILKRDIHCSIQCSKRMKPIFERSFEGIEFSSWGTHAETVAAADPPFELQYPAFSLMKSIRPSLESIVSHAPYLKPEAILRKKFRTKYEKMAKGRRIVGLSWRSKNLEVGEAKTIDLNAWAPILKTENVFFVNLQYGECSKEIESVREKFSVEIYVDPDVNALGELDPVFAQIAAVDMVVSASNSNVHIAGAMGIPTWTILPLARGLLWFWFLDREDSPWYPSVQLFRQKSTPLPGQDWWPEVIDEVAGALSDWLAKPLASRPDP